MTNDNKKLKEIITQGESITTEFKRDFSNISSALKTICAFANAEGGYLIFGVEDNGQICGVKVNNEIRTRIGNSINSSINPYPFVHISTPVVSGKPTFLIKVEKNERFLYHYGTVAYLRLDTQDIPLKFHDAENLRKRKSRNIVINIKISKEPILRVFDFTKTFIFTPIVNLVKRIVYEKETYYEIILTHKNILYVLFTITVLIASAYLGWTKGEVEYKADKEKYLQEYKKSQQLEINKSN